MVKYFISLFVLISLITFSSCNRINKGDNKAGQNPNFRIFGEVLNPENSKIIVSASSFQDTLQLTKSNNFSFNFYLEKPGYITLVSGLNSIQIYAEPDEEIGVSFNANSLSNSVQFTGNRQLENEFLNKKIQLKLNHAIPLVHLYDRPVKEFRYLVDSFYVVEKLILEEFLTANPDLSANFVKLEKASLFYDRATKLMEYPKMSSFANTINENKYFEFLEKSDLNAAELLSVYEYKSFMDAYVEYFMHKKVFNEKVREVYPYEANLARMEVVVTRFSNAEIKNHLLFNILNKQIKYYGYKNTDQLFQLFSKECKDDEYLKKLMEPYKKYQELNKGKKAPLISFQDVLDSKHDFSDYRGKYIYVDVWATWCLPCKREAPFFESLSHEYEQKNIEFLSLSIDSKKEEWVEYLNVKSKRKNQFWIQDKKQFMDAYMIKTIPHFLIIGPDGIIIDANASKPSEKVIKGWLESLPEKPNV